MFNLRHSNEYTYVVTCKVFSVFSAFFSFMSFFAHLLTRKDVKTSQYLCYIYKFFYSFFLIIFFVFFLTSLIHNIQNKYIYKKDIGSLLKSEKKNCS